MVIKMWKNSGNQVSYSLFLMDKSHKKRKASLDWFFPLGGIHKFPKGHTEDGLSVSISKDVTSSECSTEKYKIEAEEGISRIQDPLWRRVCVDILQVLGPIAFKDLWKSKLITVSPQGRKIHLACPDQAIVDTIEKYHFVIMAAFKKFYPFLSSIEMEISKDKLEKQQRHQARAR